MGRVRSGWGGLDRDVEISMALVLTHPEQATQLQSK